MYYTAPFQRTADKFNFTYGVALVVANAYLIGAFPRDYYFSVITYIFAVHMIWRHIYYLTATNLSLYLTDYCYVMNYLTIYLVNFDQKNETLLRVCFLAANGTLAFSVWAFRNSLALHRIDNLTSLFQHLVPLVMTQHLRWKVNTLESSLPEEERIFAQVDNDLSWVEYGRLMFFNPIALYLVWTSCNACIQFIICKDYIKRTNQLTLCTSFYDIKWSKKLLENSKYPPLTYLTYHFYYFFVTHFIGVACWHSFAFSFVMSTLWIMIAFWNGACYYMDYFAKRYESSLSQFDTIEKESEVATKSSATKEDETMTTAEDKTIASSEDDRKKASDG